jgi:hypothetical protein
MSRSFPAGDPEAARGQLLGILALKQATKALPWYDAFWLRKYIAALRIIDQYKPALRADFIATFDRLRTPPDFRIRKLDRVFDDAVMERIRETIRTLPMDTLEHHEQRRFGRVIVHDHPLFGELQKTLVPLASELAGEALEPSYNFLSLYKHLGVCQPHIDSPISKWTLDLCIDQSDKWPIHFSQVVPWPEDKSYGGDDWHEKIKTAPDLKFSSYELTPGEAIWFAGSSQWHYRDSLTSVSPKGFCNLLFFHFLPAGMSEIVLPANWPRLFDLPQLAAVVDLPDAL